MYNPHLQTTSADSLDRKLAGYSSHELRRVARKLNLDPNADLEEIRAALEQPPMSPAEVGLMRLNLMSLGDSISELGRAIRD